MSNHDSLENIRKRHEAAINYAKGQGFTPTQNVLDRGTLLKMVETLDRALQHRKSPGAQAFTLFDTGIAEVDEVKLKAIAAGRDGMMPFFATAILDLLAKAERHELKDVAPTDLFIAVVKKT